MTKNPDFPEENAPRARRIAPDGATLHARGVEGPGLLLPSATLESLQSESRPNAGLLSPLLVLQADQATLRNLVLQLDALLAKTDIPDAARVWLTHGRDCAQAVLRGAGAWSS